MEPILLDRGVEDYALTYAAMRKFTDSRGAITEDQLWLVEHPAVFTLGLGADPRHVINAGSIPVIQTDRGGEVTFHGPGQAVIYFLIDLRRLATGPRMYPREFVRLIEQSVIETLAAYNLVGERRSGAPGIYIADGPHQGAKIAALGLKIRATGCTYHGVSLNVNMDLSPYERINACGYPGLRSIDMRSLGTDASMREVRWKFAENLLNNLKTQAAPSTLPFSPSD
jgi:lipoyl(octanoyl) transferase